ncbi:MAG: homoserine dehydrogenase [Dehalococcoidales bacterium]|nr:homoserine dehydrogenase [Dehalococcoidales bacterium]
MHKQSIGIGLIGFGVIGSQVAKVLTEKAEILADQVGCPLVLRKIKVIEQDLTKPQINEIGRQYFTTDEDEFFSDSEIDIVIELMGGESPALQYLEKALSNGKHVVTANKEVIAKNGAGLLRMAHQNNVGLRYEASVGGGIPLIAPFQYELVANKINGIYAIINGTTNYILTRMAIDGIDFSTALASAQRLGYAEADPKNDIEGIDATYKLAILTSLALQSEVKPDDIYHEGISRLSASDFRYARELGFAIKLLAIAKRKLNTIEVRVHPAFIPQDSLLAKVDGVYNAVLVEGDLVDKVLFYGQGAGPLPTSSAVISDVVAEARDIYLNVKNHFQIKLNTGVVIRPMSEIKTRYYLRMTVADRSGVLSQITKVLGDHDISIASVIQKEADKVNQTAEAVLMTHPAGEKAMKQALEGLSHLEVITEIGNFVRVEA